MGNCEKRTKQNAETADDNIGNAQERILATHDSTGGDENGFRAVVGEDWEVFRRVSTGSRSQPEERMHLQS